MVKVRFVSTVSIHAPRRHARTHARTHTLSRSFAVGLFVIGSSSSAFAASSLSRFFAFRSADLSLPPSLPLSRSLFRSSSLASHVSLSLSPPPSFASNRRRRPAGAGDVRLPTKPLPSRAGPGRAGPRSHGSGPTRPGRAGLRAEPVGLRAGPGRAGLWAGGLAEEGFLAGPAGLPDVVPHRVVLRAGRARVSEWGGRDGGRDGRTEGGTEGRRDGGQVYGGGGGTASVRRAVTTQRRVSQCGNRPQSQLRRNGSRRLLFSASSPQH